MQLLSKYSIDFVDKNVEMLNMALIRRPVGFSEEIIAVFKMKKSQIDTENDKNPKIFLFQSFHAFFHFPSKF